MSDSREVHLDRSVAKPPLRGRRQIGIASFRRFSTGGRRLSRRTVDSGAVPSRRRVGTRPLAPPAQKPPQTAPSLARPFQVAVAQGSGQLAGDRVRLRLELPGGEAVRAGIALREGVRDYVGGDVCGSSRQAVVR